MRKPRKKLWLQGTLLSRITAAQLGTLGWKKEQGEKPAAGQSPRPVDFDEMLGEVGMGLDEEDDISKMESGADAADAVGVPQGFGACQAQVRRDGSVRLGGSGARNAAGSGEGEGESGAFGRPNCSGSGHDRDRVSRPCSTSS